ncbi:MarR family transcriptional regulator [Curtobacterium sp. Csp1]|nr:MarR family transcriptional regulator [Curtobacterium sp. Csp1]
MSSESTTGAEGSRARFPLDTVYQAARMYYLEDATQVEIASRLGVSRPTVSRLVAEARRAGLVRIDVVDPFQDETVALAERLQVVLGLRAVHLAAVTHQATLGADLAAPIATAVEGMGLTPGDAVLVSSGRTVYDVAQTGMPQLAGVQLVPTVGSTPARSRRSCSRRPCRRPPCGHRSTRTPPSSTSSACGGGRRVRSWASAHRPPHAMRWRGGSRSRTPCSTRPPVTSVSTSSPPTGRRSSSPAASAWSGRRARCSRASRTRSASPSGRRRCRASSAPSVPA